MAYSGVAPAVLSMFGSASRSISVIATSNSPLIAASSSGVVWSVSDTSLMFAPPSRSADDRLDVALTDRVVQRGHAADAADRRRVARDAAVDRVDEFRHRTFRDAVDHSHGAAGVDCRLHLLRREWSHRLRPPRRCDRHRLRGRRRPAGLRLPLRPRCACRRRDRILARLRHE